MAQRMAAAGTPSLRVAVAADHLRAVLAHLPGPAAEGLAARVVATLLEAVEQAYREEARAARTRQTW